MQWVIFGVGVLVVNTLILVHFRFDMEALVSKYMDGCKRMSREIFLYYLHEQQSE
jgi:hypothetical protein